MSKTPKPQEAPPIDPVEIALKSFMDRFSRKDPNALLDLRSWLQDHPEIWSSCGDLARQAEQAVLDLLAGPDPLLRESLFRYVQEIKAELAGPEATALEKLLAGQVVLDWLLLKLADQALLPNSPCGRPIPLTATYCEKMRENTPCTAHPLSRKPGQSIPASGAAQGAARRCPADGRRACGWSPEGY